MSKKKLVTPSRKKYDEENPILSIRVPKALKERFERHLAPSKQAPAIFIESTLDKEETVINERLNACIEQRFAAFKHRIDTIEAMVTQLICTLIDNNLPILCPQCERKGGYKLFLAWGFRRVANGKPEEYHTWKCPHCGWFYDLYGGMDPTSIKWYDPADALAEAQKKIPPKK